MNANINHIKEFLIYQLSKASASDTDRVLFLLRVLKPELFRQALQWVFLEKNAKVSYESLQELPRFAEKHTGEFYIPGGNAIHLQWVDYN